LIKPITAADRPSLINASINLLCFAVFLCLFLWLFDFSKLSQGGMLLGDDGDARFNGVILEHWFQVIRGGATWDSPSFYYPAKGVLGYSDGLILYAPIYATLRFAGADSYLALTQTVLLLPIIGYLSLFAFFRKVLALDAAGALLLSVAGILNTNFYLGFVVFYQVFTIVFVPAALLFVGLGLHACASGRRVRGALLACTGGVVMGLVALTSFYTFWFSAAIAVVAGVIFAIGGGAFLIATGAWRVAIGTLANRIRPYWPAMISALLGLVLSLIPSLMIYLPVAATRSFDANAAWERLVVWRPPAIAGIDDLFNYVATGLLPMSYGGTSLLAMVVMTYLCFSTRHGTARLLWAAGLGAVLVACLAKYRFGTLSLWSLLSMLPGGFAVRDPARIELNASLASVLALGAAIACLTKSGSNSARYARAGLYLVLLVVALDGWRRMSPARQALPHREYFETVDFNFGQTGNCRAFFIGPGGAEAQFARHPNLYQLFNLDAAYIAYRSGVPTLNGYSAFTPPGWHLTEPSDRCYMTNVDSWIEAHKLNDVCVFSYGDRNFQRYSIGDAAFAPRCK
jgi:hypothetical protein